MNDLKTTFIAGFSAAPSFIFALAENSRFAIFTSIVLPILFFVGSKTIDVLVQLYLQRRKNQEK
jgi:hypothetical protein